MADMLAGWRVCMTGAGGVEDVIVHPDKTELRSWFELQYRAIGERRERDRQRGSKTAA